MEKSKEFLVAVAKALVNSKEEVNVETKTDERGVLLTLHVNPKDVGRIIGKEGHTAAAIRTLLKSVGMQENARVSMVIFDPRRVQDGQE